MDVAIPIQEENTTLEEKSLIDWKPIRKWARVNVVFIGMLFIIALIIYAIVKVLTAIRKYQNNN